MSLQPSTTLDYYYDVVNNVGEIRYPTATAGNLPTGVTVVSATCNVSARYGASEGPLTCTINSPSAFVVFNSTNFGLGCYVLFFVLTLSNGGSVDIVIEINVWPATEGRIVCNACKLILFSY